MRCVALRWRTAPQRNTTHPVWTSLKLSDASRWVQKSRGILYRQVFRSSTILCVRLRRRRAHYAFGIPVVTVTFGKNKHLYTACLKKVTTLACYNFDVHQPILIIFESNFAKKVNNLTVLCIAVAVLWFILPISHCKSEQLWQIA